MTTLLTLTRNHLDVTRRCLPSWFDTRDDEPWELLVVDNGSTDGTLEWLHTLTAQVAAQGIRMRVRPLGRNAGCSTARNLGIEMAEGDWIAFLDNDVALRCRDWLRRLRSALEDAPERVLAGPKLVYPFAPYPIQCAGVGISRTGRVWFRGRGEPIDAPAFASGCEVQCLISACCLGRTEAVRAAGGFDEAFNPVQFEDFDLCYRLRERGGVLWYCPEVEMYHFESVTTQGSPELVNAEIVVRHGLRFKARWRHRFENEEGPPEAWTRWRRVAVPTLPSIGDLPQVN